MKTTPSDDPVTAAATVVHEVLKPKKKIRNSGAHISLSYLSVVFTIFIILYKKMDWCVVVQALFFGFAERGFLKILFFIFPISQSLGFRFLFLDFFKAQKRNNSKKRRKQRASLPFLLPLWDLLSFSSFSFRYLLGFFSFYFFGFCIQYLFDWP